LVLGSGNGKFLGVAISPAWDTLAVMFDADAIALMTDRIRQACNPRRIVLFGSHARGQAGPDSDVDLLVVLDHITDRRREAVALRRLLADIPVAKDVVLTTPEEIARRGELVGTLLRPALREGIILPERG
jgi:predicted nucleotidyltransferase